MGFHPLEMKAVANFYEELNVNKLGFENITPVNAVASSLTTVLAGADNDLVFTAKTKGVAGNDITVAYINPMANDAVLIVVVTGTDIVINLATDGAGVITTTSGDIITAIEANAEADALVSVVNSGADDGTGLVIALAETPLAGGVNGTVASEYKVAFDGDFLYIAVANNTISDANWKRITASSF